jgi:hypothetical protein
MYPNSRLVTMGVASLPRPAPLLDVRPAALCEERRVHYAHVGRTNGVGVVAAQGQRRRQRQVAHQGRCHADTLWRQRMEWLPGHRLCPCARAREGGRTGSAVAGGGGAQQHDARIWSGAAVCPARSSTAVGRATALPLPPQKIAPAYLPPPAGPPQGRYDATHIATLRLRTRVAQGMEGPDRQPDGPAGKNVGTAAGAAHP